MLDGSSRRFAMILEDQHVTEALVVLQIEHAIAISPQHIFQRLLRQLSQRGLMLRRLDNDFMSADAIHLVEQAFAFAIQFAFNSQRGKTVGHHANVPAAAISPATIPAISENFGRRLGLVARAERAILWRTRKNGLAQKVHGTLPTVCGNNDPPRGNWIFT